jgi:pyruvate/2-oxoglutarate dehydrogenase complex dihydrolipoamide dehydrogenase (E3) component
MVTVIDRNHSVIHGEDDDTTEGLQSLFKDEGIELILNARLKNISGVSGQSVRHSRAGRSGEVAGGYASLGRSWTCAEHERYWGWNSLESS